jgi:hypothetical protein
MLTNIIVRLFRLSESAVLPILKDVWLSEHFFHQKNVLLRTPLYVAEAEAQISENALKSKPSICSKSITALKLPPPMNAP